MAEGSERDRRPGAARWTLGDEDPPIAHGAALGAGGVEGWWAWKHRRRTRRGMDAVSPATWRGATHVMLWCCGLIAITAVGASLGAGPPALWFAIAVLVMVGVAWAWDRRTT